jgi:hypothetical protein
MRGSLICDATPSSTSERADCAVLLFATQRLLLQASGLTARFSYLRRNAFLYKRAGCVRGSLICDATPSSTSERAVCTVLLFATQRLCLYASGLCEGFSYLRRNANYNTLESQVPT